MQKKENEEQRLNAKSWDDIWNTHLENYLIATPRTGIVIHSLFGNASKVLEIACGSGRDAYYLFTKNMAVSAIDYANETIEKLKVKFPNGINFQSQDAFAMNYNDKEFDVTFHNGFYVLFENDEDVKKLICEQARITNKNMVIIEHNLRNSKLVDKFARKSSSDPIYNIRFYDPDELVNLVKLSGIDFHSIRVQKFGGWPDMFYGLLEKFKWLKKFQAPLYWTIPRLYTLVPWKKVERCMVIVDMK